MTLSPIYLTPTKPGYGPALGAAHAASLAAAHSGALRGEAPGGGAVRGGGVAWLALGGVDSAGRAAECAVAGAAGIAVLGAVMRAADPERVARTLAGSFAAAQNVATPPTSTPQHNPPTPQGGGPEFQYDREVEDQAGGLWTTAQCGRAGVAGRGVWA